MNNYSISAAIRSFTIALSFLTVFRVKSDSPPTLEEVGGIAWAFPVVGAALGIVLALIFSILAGLFPPALSAVITVAFWVVLTGGLHLDGWSDCCDALPTALPPERRYEILKDSRLGTFGALGLILVLAVKTAALTDPNISLTTIMVAPIVGRALVVLAAQGVRHDGKGMAAAFISGLQPRSVSWAGIIGFGSSLLLGWTGLAAAAGAYLGARWFRNLAESRLPAVNGDVIGGTCELAEALFLVIASIR